MPSNGFSQPNAGDLQEAGKYSCEQSRGRLNLRDMKHSVKYLLNSASIYFCFKNKFSIIVVLAIIVGPNYKFICVDGGAEKVRDKEKNKANELLYLRLKALPGQNLTTPHCLKGYEALANCINSSPLIELY